MQEVWVFYPSALKVVEEEDLIGQDLLEVGEVFYHSTLQEREAQQKKMSQEEEEEGEVVGQMSQVVLDLKVVWVVQVVEPAAAVVQPNHIGEVASWLLA